MLSKGTSRQIQNFMYNIAWLRKQNNLSKKEMAKILNISVYHINKLEKGVLPNHLSADLVFNIRNHFGIHPTKQFGEKLKK